MVNNVSLNNIKQINNIAIDHLKNKKLQWSETTRLNNESMHDRCCAHILNLGMSD